MFCILVFAYFENKTSVKIYPKTFGRKIRFFALVLQMLDVTVLYEKDTARALIFNLEK
jgi:hypothetical protein